MNKLLGWRIDLKCDCISSKDCGNSVLLIFIQTQEFNFCDFGEIRIIFMRLKFSTDLLSEKACKNEVPSKAITKCLDMNIAQ